MQGSEASGGVGDGVEAAAPEFVEHGGADVDGKGGGLRIAEEELLEEAAVAVAEDECVARIVEFAEEERSRALEKRAERDVFGPAVDRGDAIEVRLRRGSRTDGIQIAVLMRDSHRKVGHQNEIHV